MKKVAKNLFILLATVVTMCVLSVVASAETYGDLKYSIANNEITITGCSASATEVVIPSEIEGLTVTQIGYSAFKNCENLTTITIPESISKIYPNALKNCTNLTQINWNAKNVTNFSASSEVFYNVGISTDGTDVIFGDSVESIPDYLFWSYPKDYDPVVRVNIKSVKFGKSVSHIGKSAFFNCKNIKSVIISDLSSWCKINFAGSYSNPLCYAGQLYINNVLAENIIIPDDVTTISAGVFSYCSCLKSITMGKSVSHIEENAFYECKNLEAVKITDLSSWCKINFADLYSNPLYYAGKLYINDVLAENITIPDDVTTISADVFSYCSSLKSLTIGKSVTEISNNAFDTCSSLSEINVTPDNTEYASNNGVLFSKSLRILIKYPTAKQEIDYVLPSGVYRIMPYAFKDCKYLENIILNNDIQSIDSYVITNCNSLKSITISEQITTIADNAFNNCENLEKIYWNAKKVNDYSYSNNIFSNVGINGKGVTVIFGSTVEHVPAHLFYSDYFSYSAKITSVTFSKSIKSIGKNAFYNCAYLTKIYWNTNNVKNFFSDTTIFDNSGQQTDGISVVFGDNVTHIPSYILNNAYVKSVKIPDSVTSIGEYSFSYCLPLTEIDIPDSVTSIGQNTFYGCTALKDIYFYNPNCLNKGNISYGIHLGVTIHSHSGYAVNELANQYGYDFENLHVFSENLSTPANCTVAGKKYLKCKYCDVTTNVTELPPKGHTSETVKGFDATCTKTGLTDGEKCSVCGEITVEQKSIPMIAHTFGKWTVVKAPTASAEGREERACSVCGKKETRAVAKLDFILGDVNGDNQITAEDARLALRLSAGLENFEELNVSVDVVDYNKDKQITAEDARRILRKSAGLE